MYTALHENTSLVEALLLSLNEVGTFEESVRCKVGMLLAVDDAGRTAFHYLAHFKHPALSILVRELSLVATNVDVFKAPFWPSSSACVPLPVAQPSSARGEDLVSAVLQHRAAGPMPQVFDQAALSGDRETITMLDERGCLPKPGRDVEAGIDPPIVCAVTGRNVKVVQQLKKLYEGNNVWQIGLKGNYGETALHRAAVCHDAVCFDTLLNSPGADTVLMGPAPSGWTDEQRTKTEAVWRSVVLARFAASGDDEGLKQLLANGAQVRLCLCHNCTAARVAQPTTLLHTSLPFP